ncbi:MAG: NAD(P)-dependent glycerol-3-phosphate dehydrogenase [Rhodobacteraceae bacterium]|nr:NAD(P)-dependent glycerol-3-phosphate dehydrogenase [Paracoccaceae bacterium]
MTGVTVYGAGAFGTALAAVWTKAGRDVILWGRDAGVIEAVKTTGRNTKYLPGIELPRGLNVTASLERAAGADISIIAVPAQHTRHFCKIMPSGGTRVVVSKGIETASGQLPHDIAGAAAVISGPGFAQELAKGKPTALSLGCADESRGAELQQILSTGSLRLYLNPDIMGVALGGALKNVYAIACGLVAGTGLGESARAALMTRGFAEMSRLCHQLGVHPETLTGLSGFGDLALSSASRRSRNFNYGYELGANDVQNTGKIVEGIATAEAVLLLGRKHGAALPVASVVARVLSRELSVPDAVTALMSRPLKQEV